jgi:hypothetical protein
MKASNSPMTPRQTIFSSRWEKRIVIPSIPFDIYLIKPAAPLLACVIRLVFFLHPAVVLMKEKSA